MLLRTYVRCLWLLLQHRLVYPTPSAEDRLRFWYMHIVVCLCIPPGAIHLRVKSHVWDLFPVRWCTNPFSLRIFLLLELILPPGVIPKLASTTRIPVSLLMLKEPVQRRSSTLVALGLFLVTLLLPGIVQSGPHLAVSSPLVVVPSNVR